MRYSYRVSILIGVLTVGFLVSIVPGFVIAENFGTSLEEQKKLQEELKKIEIEITKLERELMVTKGEKKTLANRVFQLRTEQNAIKLQISATELQLKDLDGKLKETAENIVLTEKKARELKNNLAALLRVMYQRNHEAVTFRLVLQGRLGDAMSEVRSLEKLSNSIGDLLERTREMKMELEKQKEAYALKEDEVSELLKLTTAQHSALGGKLSEHTQLLKDTQGKEENYQSLIKGNKARAAEIKSRIYELLDVGTQITFGEAVTIATWVNETIGVPASLLLAILTQESNLGKNVGTCNRLGDPPEKSWKVIMKPTRDQEPFKKITEELGKDPDITPVSCPMRNKDGSQLGWGGAMGPAQFIPSTWMGYKDKVSAITGKSPANPWDIRDAFLASALLLKANGADGTREGNWKAAMRYFSGGTDPKYRFYGDNVLKLADEYEDDIAALQ